MRIGKKTNRKEVARDGIHYEVMRRNLTPRQFAYVENLTVAIGWRESSRLLMTGNEGRVPIRLRKHMQGACREMERISKTVERIREAIRLGLDDNVRALLDSTPLIAVRAKERGLSHPFIERNVNRITGRDKPKEPARTD